MEMKMQGSRALSFKTDERNGAVTMGACCDRQVEPSVGIEGDADVGIVGVDDGVRVVAAAAVESHQCIAASRVPRRS